MHAAPPSTIKRIKRASHERRLIASLAWQGVLQPAKVVRRVTDASGAVSGRPSGRGRPSSMALLSFAKQALRVKIFWNGLRKLGKEEIRLRSLLRGPGYGVTTLSISYHQSCQYHA